MEILKFSIAAGETKRFEKAGRYIEVVDADSALSLFFFDENGGQVEDATDIVSGLYVEEPYRAFSVYSGGAQSITLMVSSGRGGSRRQPGNVRVVNRVSAQCQQSVNAATVVGDSIVTILAPASNTLGVVIRSVFLNAQPGAGGVATLQVFAAKTPPGSAAAIDANLTEFVLISRVASTDTAVLAQRGDAAMQLEIPAGWGLYIGRINTVAVAVASSSRVSYEISM